MKKLILAALPALICIIMTSCGNAENNSLVNDAQAKCDNALDVIMTRTSVRQYTDQAISEGTIDTLLRAGMAAPTAGNKQPWKFIVVTERASLDSLATGNWRMAAHAQAAIIVWRLFGIPSQIVPMSIVMLGYPAGEHHPKDKYKPENIHYNKW